MSAHEPFGAKKIRRKNKNKPVQFHLFNIPLGPLRGGLPLFNPGVHTARYFLFKS
jgi:hypothetical protein